MSVKEAIVIVEKKDLEKASAKIAKLEEQIADLKEVFAALSGTTKAPKKTRAPKQAQQEATEQAATENAPVETQVEEPTQQAATTKASKAATAAVTPPKAAPATPTKTVVAKAPVPTKGNGATKMTTPRMPGAH